MVVEGDEMYIVVKRTLHSGVIKYVVMKKKMRLTHDIKNPVWFYVDVDFLDSFDTKELALDCKAQIMQSVISSEEVVG